MKIAILFFMAGSILLGVVFLALWVKMFITYKFADNTQAQKSDKTEVTEDLITENVISNEDKLR